MTMGLPFIQTRREGPLHVIEVVEGQLQQVRQEENIETLNQGQISQVDIVLMTYRMIQLFMLILHSLSHSLCSFRVDHLQLQHEALQDGFRGCPPQGWP